MTKSPGNKQPKKLRALPMSRACTTQDIIDKARQYGPACLDSLAEVAASGPAAARVSAANSLLERGFGKVGQVFEITGAGGGPLEHKHVVDLSGMNADELITLARVVFGKEGA